MSLEIIANSEVMNLIGSSMDHEAIKAKSEPVQPPSVPAYPPGEEVTYTPHDSRRFALPVWLLRAEMRLKDNLP